MDMWDLIRRHFKDYPERLKVARALVEKGLTVRDGKIYLDEIEIPSARVARAVGVDRRTVHETIEVIQSNHELRQIFEGLRSAGHSLREIAKHLGFGVVEITPVDARLPGILANSAMILANRGISIRQAITDDPELSPEPKLTLIADGRIPGELIPEFLKVRGVAKVSIY